MRYLSVLLFTICTSQAAPTLDLWNRLRENRHSRVLQKAIDINWEVDNQTFMGDRDTATTG